MRGFPYHGGSPVHQRPSFVFSAAVLALLAVSASEGIDILKNRQSMLGTLQENVRAICAVLDRNDSLTIPSHATSPIIHIHLRTATPSLTVAAPKVPNPATAASRDALSLDIAGEEHLLQQQDTADGVLVLGVRITAKGLDGCVGGSSLSCGRVFASL